MSPGRGNPNSLRTTSRKPLHASCKKPSPCRGNKNGRASAAPKRHRARCTGVDACPTVPSRFRCCRDRKSTRLNSSHSQISYAVFCLKKKKTKYKAELYSHTRLLL